MNIRLFWSLNEIITISHLNPVASTQYILNKWFHSSLILSSDNEAESEGDISEPG